MYKRAVDAAGQPHPLEEHGGEGAVGSSPPPAQRSLLVGRQGELGALAPLLLRTDVPLLTLTGPGGIGKTRLALRLMAERADDFADGAFLVTLASLRDPDLVLPSIGRAFGIAEGVGGTLLERLQAHLRPRQLLLVLDNFEHLMAAAPVVAALLSACPRLKALVTSRAPLRLSGEHEYPVPPLPVPDAGGSLEPERLLQYAAVKLFCERVQAVRPSFVLTSGNVAAVTEVCRRLDGLPLALELAAARCKLFTPQALLGRLEGRLELLTGGTRDLPERQQTLRSTIDWSYRLLSAAQQRLFRRLAVFDGGAELNAAQAVCGAPGEEPILVDDLVQVLDHSLVHLLDTSGGETRVGMLETIRGYALEKLGESGEEEAVRRTHARYFLGLAEEAGARPDGGEAGRRRDQLEAEHANLRTALRWSVAHREPALALRLAHLLGGLWESSAYLHEGRRWLDEVLALEPSGESRELRAGVCHHAALLATRQSDWHAAAARAEESVRLYREIGAQPGVAHALLTLALIATMRDDHARSAELHRQLLPMFERLDDPAGLARATHNFGLAYRFEKPREALELGERSLALYRRAQLPRGVAQAQNLIGWARLNLGDAAGARASFAESLQACLRLQLRWVAGYVFQGASDAVRLQGQTRLAVELLSASDALFRRVDAPVRQVRLEQHYRQLVETLRAEHDEASFQDAWAAGQTAALEELAAELHRQPAPEEPRPVPAGWDASLTPREREVLALVAQGLTDKRVARRLGISPTTVSKHVANALGKTGLHNRVELTRLVLTGGGG